MIEVFNGVMNDAGGLASVLDFFSAHDLLVDGVVFLEGWLAQTLPRTDRCICTARLPCCGASGGTPTQLCIRGRAA